ncbi:MAG: diguanylate cyclase, partial [Candidatus Mariimomonas ferrooxydans]
MKLKQKLNIIFFLVIAFILAIAGFSFFAAYNIFRGSGGEYQWVVQRLNTNIYTLIIVSALTAVSGVLIYKGLMSRILNLIGEINSFTQNMIQGQSDAKLEVKGSDELGILAGNLNKIADSYKEKVSGLENAMAKRQKAIRELAILNELMSFITSEFKIDAILKNFVDRTKDLIKSDFCAVVTFEPESYSTELFVTSEDIQDPSKVSLNPQGFFKTLLEEMTPLRLSSKKQYGTGAQLELIKIPDLNLEVNDILAVPLASTDKLFGLMLLANKKEGSYDQDDEDVLMNFAFQAFQTISMHEEITSLAVTDGLTGINNHRHFQERLTEEVEISKRYGRNLSLLILDVDNFKSFNDIYGHQVGDVVLKSIAFTLEEQSRKTDFPARYGGEEFALIMPETNFSGARILAERLRKKISTSSFDLPGSEKALITVSIGFASMPENAKDKIELIEMSDKALYFAKEHGRNLTYGFEEGHFPGREALFNAKPVAIENLADIVDSRTPYTKGHSSEVARLAILIANEMGLEEGAVESLRIASMLHDIGTIHIPERVLNKPGELTDEEKKVIKAHPGLAEMVLKKYPHIEEVLPAILYHHERFDGNGYPKLHTTSTITH